MAQSPSPVDIRACAWCDDGTLLAAGTAGGVALWGFGEGLSLRPLGAPDAVDALAFGNAGHCLWSAGDGWLRCYDLVTGAALRQIETAGRVVALSLGGRAWATDDGNVLEIRMTDEPGEAYRFARPDARPPLDDEADDEVDDEACTSRATCVAFAPGGREVVAGYADGACWVFEPWGTACRQLQGPDGRRLSAAAWGPNADVLVVAGDGRFAVYGGPRRKRRPHEARATSLFERVTAIAFSPRGGEFAVTSEYDAIDGTQEDLEFIRVDGVDGRRDRRYVQLRDLVQRRHIPSGRAAVFSPSGRVLAICKRYGGVSLWDADERCYLGTLEAFGDRSAGMLVNEPWTVGELGRIELVGDPTRLRGLGPGALPRWAADSAVSTGRGPLTAALARRLERRR